MHEQFEKVKIQIITMLIIQIGILIGLLLFSFNLVLFALLVFFVLNVSVIAYLIYQYQTDLRQRVIDITRILGKEAKDALLIGGIGIVTYDENYVVTWANELLEEEGVSIIGQRITSLSPQINELLLGERESVELQINERTFQVTKKGNSSLLYIRDQSEYVKLHKKYVDEQVVIGYIHLDNYEEVTQYEEEQTIAHINSKLRQPVVEWAKNHGMFVRRIKSDRYSIVLNDRIYQAIIKERFSILDYIRETAHQLDVNVTLSMAFAKGVSDFLQLDEMANNALELAQSRGGDQVAMNHFDKGITYFGGSSQAQEKRSKVSVRVMAQGLKELMIQCSSMIVVVHKEMDFDCMGSALALSRIGNALSKPVSIISKSGGVEEKLNKAMHHYKKHLDERHDFVSESEALELYTEDTLVIVVDHHKKDQSNGANLLEIAKKIVVIDHHRRQKDFDFNPMMVYIESSSSSVVELISEMIPYFSLPLDISPIEATMMLTGILVDTNRFRNRTGARTFEVASMLKEYGADPIEGDMLLKDEINEFELKTKILNRAQYLDHGIVLVPYDEDKTISRTVMSQVADTLLNVKDVEATFVCANTDQNLTAISARSKGNVNVQVIMEAMEGGGHFSAAATQREDSSVSELVEQLLQVIDDYFAQKE